MLDAASSAPMLSFTHADATVTPAQLVSVASAVTDIQAPATMRGEGGGLGDSAGGEVARGADTLASLAVDGPDYADHGWLIVPSTTNEYGPAYAAAADGFSFDVAAGEFSSDWFWV